MKEWQTSLKNLTPGKARKTRDGKDLALISIGHVGNYALEAANALAEENIQAACFDMRFLKPIDEEMLHQIFRNYKRIITIEDGTIVGGLGSAVLEFQSDHNYEGQVKRLGIPDTFVGHGTQDELHHDCGYDVAGIRDSVKKMMEAE